MKFTKTEIEGLYTIELTPFEDDRGYFARNFDIKEFKENTGEDFNVVNINRSYNKYKGTIRGMHFQKPQMQEGKIVQCIRGRLLDVAVDIRKDSPTFGKYFSVELTPENRKMLYIPKDFAHGIQVLEDNTELIYFVSQFYSKEHDAGVRWSDPDLGIKWPLPPTVISDRDKKLPYLRELK